MKKNGFTLVELLAVLALLAIIATIAVTSAINISKGIKEDMFCEKVGFLLNDAKRYGSDRLYEISNNEAYPTVITIGKLVEMGYVKKDQKEEDKYIINPIDDSSMDELRVGIYLKNKRAYARFMDLDTSMCD